MLTYLSLFLTYLKIGLFGFGGGYAMLSLIQHETVEVVHWGETAPWLTQSEFTDIVAISQMTPGPIGINSATYIGYSVTGSVLGSIVATIAVCLPSFLLVLFVSRFILRHKENPIIKSIFKGLRPVVVGLIASAALLLMNRENFSDNTFSIAIAVVSFILVYFTKLHPIFIIILAGVAGYIIY
ncbi:MAG: chromate transporter [Bacteroidaceae bacterium]|nr:chromate transporter [Bacteroidaceae bacterium]